MNKINSFYPNLGMSWATVAVFFAATFITAIFISFLTMMQGGLVSNDPWSTLISYVAPFFLTAGFIYLLQRHTPTEPFPVSRNLSAGLLFLLLIFTLLLGFVIEPLSMWIPMPDFIKQLFTKAIQLNTPSFLMTVIAAPILEEWLCRGTIMKGLLKHGTPAKAILWSAFLFAFIHLNPWQAIPAFIIGLLLGYVYWKTQSLWPCIFIHFVNNGWSFLMMYLFPGIEMDISTQDLIGGNYWLFYSAALFVTIGIGYVLYRVLHRHKITKTIA